MPDLPQKPTESQYLRLAELMTSFSLAMDLGLGQPLDWVMRSCLLGLKLSRLLGLSTDEQRQVYYLSLLQHIGCTSVASWQAELFGDELAMGRALTLDAKNPLEAFPAIINMAGQGQSLPNRIRHIGRALAAGPGAKDQLSIIQCDVASNFAARLGFEPAIIRALGQIYERWDGQGQPNQIHSEEITLPIRVVHLAHDAATVQLQTDAKTAIELIEQRAGKLYDPAIAEVFLGAADELLAELEVASTWDAVLEAESDEVAWLTQQQFDEALYAIADFADLKSPYFGGHSRGVASLAESASRALGLPDADSIGLRRAGLIHDLGRVGVSSAIWNKPGPLTESEWERVRLHPYYTERILMRSNAFSPLVELAILHHERLDGSGYHRRLPANMQPLTARILSAADAYHTMIEDRPHRPALSRDDAAVKLRDQGKRGKLDPSVVEAVLGAAGHAAASPRHTAPGGLSKREIEVLRLLARGHSNPEIAEQLVISKKTVGHHVQHIYDKINVSTRAGATLFAMQNNLLSTLDLSV